MRQLEGRNVMFDLFCLICFAELKRVFANVGGLGFSSDLGLV